MKRGDVSQMSFAFSVKPGGQDWAKNDDGIVIRSLKAVRLFDVSVVTFPAYAATEVAVRSMAAWQNQPGPDARPNMTLALADLARALA
jgi:HK97 family phage prohead protease